MEKWQRELIENNLTELANETACSEEFIEMFASGNVLGPTHVTNLESSGLVPTDKSKKLYQLVTKQPGSFDVLIRSLEETKQTKALKMLLDWSSIFPDKGVINYDKEKVLRPTCFMGDKIYRGTFGHGVGGMDVAVKVINADIAETRLALREVEMLKKLKGQENIISYFSVEAREGSIQIALELFEITLQDQIKLNAVNINPVKILKKCTKGVAYLHSMNVIHTDLNPTNVLLMANGQVKICNFGLAEQITTGMETVTLRLENVRDRDWTAPELLTEASAACDIFSLGCIFFFLLTKGKHPFGDAGERKSRKTNIFHGKQKIPDSALDQNWLQLIKRMISHTASDRLSAKQVLLDCSFAAENSTCSASHSEKQPAPNLGVAMGSEASSSDDIPTQLPPDFESTNNTEEETPASRPLPTQPTPDVAFTNSTEEDIPAASTPCTRRLRRPLPTQLARDVAITNNAEKEIPVASTSFKRRLRKPLSTQQAPNVAIANNREEEMPLLSTSLKRGLRSSGPIVDSQRPCSSASAKKQRISLRTQAEESPVDELGNNAIFSAVLKGTALKELKRIVENNMDVERVNNAGESILHLAIRHKDSEVLNFFISAGANVHAKDKAEDLPIHKLRDAEHGFKEKLVVLCENGANINAEDADGNNILALAVSAGRAKEDVEFIINKSGDWKRKNKIGQTILHLAVEGGNPEVIELLMKIGMEINVEGEKGSKPIHQIAFTKRNFKATLDALLAHDAFINAKDNDGDTVLAWAAMAGRSLTDLEYIISKGGDMAEENNNGQSLLHAAAEGGNPEVIKFLIECGAVVNLKDKNKEVPLHQIPHTKKDFKGSLDVLLESGATINERNDHGNMLLNLSVFHGRPQTDLEYVVAKGGKWRLKNNHGKCVLHCAAEGGNIEALNYFISLGVSIKSVDSEGKLPLHDLVDNMKNFKETLDAVLKNGTAVNATDRGGNTLLLLAAWKGRTTDILEYIIQKGGDWKKKNNSKQSILHSCALAGNVEALKYFIARGAEVNVRDEDGYSPMHFLAYAEENFKECVEVLLKHGGKINEKNKKGYTLLDLAVVEKRDVKDCAYIVRIGGTGKK